MWSHGRAKPNLSSTSWLATFLLGFVQAARLARVARSEGKGEVNRPVFQLQLAALLQEQKLQSQSIVSDGVSRFPGHCMTCLTQLSVQAPPESALFASSLGPLVISIAVSATRADLMRSLAYGPIYSPAPGRVIHQVKGQRASLGG